MYFFVVKFWVQLWTIEWKETKVRPNGKNDLNCLLLLMMSIVPTCKLCLWCRWWNKRSLVLFLWFLEVTSSLQDVMNKAEPLNFKRKGDFFKATCLGFFDREQRGLLCISKTFVTHFKKFCNTFWKGFFYGFWKVLSSFSRSWTAFQSFSTCIVSAGKEELSFNFSANSLWLTIDQTIAERCS